MQPQSPANPVSPATSSIPIANNMIPTGKWPGGIFGAYKYSKELVKFNLSTLLLLLLTSLGAYLILTILESLIPNSSKNGTSFIGDIINYFISGFISVGLAFTYASSVKNTRVSISEAYSVGMSKILQAALYSFISGVIILLSFLALIIPFFFVAPRLTFGYYLLVEKDMDAVQALQATWSMSKGHVLKIYGIGIGIFLMCLLALTIIGIPFAIYMVFMYQAGYFVLYKFIENQGGTQQSNSTSNQVNSVPSSPASTQSTEASSPTPQPVLPATTPSTLIPHSPSEAPTQPVAEPVADPDQPKQ